jgi:ABC-2 type transport system permease protein
MKLRRVRAIARKEFLHIIRDPRSLGMGIAIPMLMLLLFGYALTLDVDDVPIMIWDQSHTTVSRDLISQFGGSRYFSIYGYASSPREIERAIDRREVLAALVIPWDFARNVGRSGAQAQLIVDGSDANTAAIAIAYANAIASQWSLDISVQAVRRRGGVPAAMPVDVRPRVWFNPEMESRLYIVPGLIAVIMSVIAALMTSLTIAREWETGTMEQLISTPVRGYEIIIGKLIPYFVIGAIDVVIAVVMGLLLFQVPFRGAPLLMVAFSSVFLIGTLSLGILISILTRGQLLASQVAMVTTFLPAFLLSGFMFDIANMPRPVQAITYLMPARYFVALLKALFLKGVGVPVLAADGVPLLIFAAAMLLLAIARFKKKLV